jgi:hypothetical protein
MAIPRPQFASMAISEHKSFHTYWAFIYSYDHHIFHSSFHLEHDKIHVFPLNVYTPPTGIQILYTEKPIEQNNKEQKQILYKKLGISNVKACSIYDINPTTHIICMRVGFGYKNIPVDYKTHSHILFYTAQNSPTFYSTGNHPFSTGTGEDIYIPTNDILCETIVGYSSGMGTLSTEKTYGELLEFLCGTQFSELLTRSQNQVDDEPPCDPSQRAIDALMEYKRIREEREREEQLDREQREREASQVIVE